METMKSQIGDGEVAALDAWLAKNLKRGSEAGRALRDVLDELAKAKEKLTELEHKVVGALLFIIAANIQGSTCKMKTKIQG